MKQNIATGIDIGTSYIRVAVCETADGVSSSPVILGSSVIESKGIHRGYIVNYDEALTSLKKALQEAERSSGQKIRSAGLAIGGVGINSEYTIGSSLVSRADNIVTKLDIDKCIADAETKLNLKNRVILNALPIVFKIDGKEIPGRPEGINGSKLEIKVLFLICFQQHYEDFLSLADDAGIKVASINPSALVSEKLLLTDLQRNFGCALVDIGSETVSVSVYENNILTSLNIFGIGSADITKDIALGLRVTPEEAENIKVGTINTQVVPKRKLEEIIEARLSDIFELIDKYFKRMGRSGLLPAGVIIIGGGSYLNMIENVAKNMLKIPAKVGYLSLPVQSDKKPELKYSRDQRLLVAYATAANLLKGDNSKNKKYSPEENDGLWTVLKNFIKQLMP